MANVLDRAIHAHRAGRLAEAKALYAETLFTTRHNLGLLAVAMRDLPEADRQLREALALNNSPESAFSLSGVLLRMGRYADGWAFYERRRELERLKIVPGPDHTPPWRGEDVTGKRVVVIGEQGFGDQLMFARYLPVLAARGAEVIYHCSPRLTGLMEAAGVAATPGAAGAETPRGDFWSHIGSLPHWLGLDEIPPPFDLRFLNSGETGTAVLAGASAADPRKSLGGEDAARLLRLGVNLDPAVTGAGDFLATARIIAPMARVITVDTATAHLAGAMGKAVWILLPHGGTDWRWPLDGSPSPWYPDARLLYQPKAGDWSSVLDQVEADLAEVG